jgi:hypothetical protein
VALTPSLFLFLGPTVHPAGVARAAASLSLPAILFRSSPAPDRPPLRKAQSHDPVKHALRVPVVVLLRPFHGGSACSRCSRSRTPPGLPRRLRPTDLTRNGPLRECSLPQRLAFARRLPRSTRRKRLCVLVTGPPLLNSPKSPVFAAPFAGEITAVLIRRLLRTPRSGISIERLQIAAIPGRTAVVPVRRTISNVTGTWRPVTSVHERAIGLGSAITRSQTNIVLPGTHRRVDFASILAVIYSTVRGPNVRAARN